MTRVSCSATPGIFMLIMFSSLSILIFSLSLFLASNISIPPISSLFPLFVPLASSHLFCFRFSFSFRILSFLVYIISLVSLVSLTFSFHIPLGHVNVISKHATNSSNDRDRNEEVEVDDSHWVLQCIEHTQLSYYQKKK